MATVEAIFSDGERFTFDARADETVLAAARRHGLALASDCETGECQTCVGTIKSGAIDYEDGVDISLSDADVAAGLALCCVATPRDNLVIELPYTRASLLPVRTAYLSVTAVEPLCKSAVALRGKLMRNAKLDFYAGQYVNLTVPGTTHQRAYSMANPPEEPDALEFLVRLIDGGAMSEFLRAALQSGPAPGTVFALKGPYGVFYRREREAPMLMIAGGTGLAPMLAMLRQLVQRGASRRRITLCFGVTAADDLFGLDVLDRLAETLPGLERRVAIMRPDASWSGTRGVATDLLTPADLEGAPDAYLCGPPPMIAAARAWLAAHGQPPARIFAEEFTPTGT
ncbi:MAG TPA: 2Fe-2S iron-sulfur cluster binding domain-containing protein [Candidatus Sulfotelmatobacter sp.]|nr:2Fe-2S iron-sulfur cluster binding domain-containing protein [Candidatus Sulfotelmatobacter sp.]